MTHQMSRNLGQQRLQAVEDFDILGKKGLFLLCILLKILRQDVSSFICPVLIIVNLEVVMREFLGPAELSKA